MKDTTQWGKTLELLAEKDAEILLLKEEKEKLRQDLTTTQDALTELLLGGNA